MLSIQAFCKSRKAELGKSYKLMAMSLLNCTCVNNSNKILVIIEIMRP